MPLLINLGPKFTKAGTLYKPLHLGLSIFLEG